MERIRTMDLFQEVIILLVEDDRGDQKLVAKALSNDRIANELRVADSAEDAVAYLRRSQEGDTQSPFPDLILLDLNMPGMGGQEFLRWLKSEPGLASIPVVILTTSDAEKDIIESFKFQAAGYIKKPGSLEGFHEVLHNVTGYWFVICKRAPHADEYRQRANMCPAG